jgi:hypothetical protein
VRRMAPNWLRVLGIAELPHIDQGVRQQFHAKVSLLPVFNTQQQPWPPVLEQRLGVAVRSRQDTEAVEGERFEPRT